MNTALTNQGTTVHKSLMVPGEISPDNGDMAEMHKALSAAYFSLEGTSPNVRGLFVYPAIGLVKPLAQLRRCVLVWGNPGVEEKDKGSRVRWYCFASAAMMICESRMG